MGTSLFRLNVRCKAHRLTEVICTVLLHLVTHPSPSAIASHIRSAVAPSPTAPPTTTSSGDVSGLMAALIGVGGSVVGGAVGGWLTMVAGRQQSRRDREDGRLERSKQAAVDIAAAWPVLEEALLDRAGGKIPADGLHKAFNVFSTTATMQSIPITNDLLRKHIRGHVMSVLEATQYADAPERLSPRVEHLRQSGGEMCQAIDAHYRDKPLPPYGGTTEADRAAADAETRRWRLFRRQRQSSG